MIKAGNVTFLLHDVHTFTPAHHLAGVYKYGKITHITPCRRTVAVRITFTAANVIALDEQVRRQLVSLQGAASPVGRLHITTNAEKACQVRGAAWCMDIQAV